MKLLTKIGSVVLKIIGIWTGFQPLIQSAVPQTGTAVAVEDKITKLFSVIGTTEQIFQAAFGGTAKMGSDKLKAATPFVAQLIQQTDLLVGKKPKDEALFVDASTRLTAALADILNSYGE